jgi:Uma2 family endonuclease
MPTVPEVRERATMPYHRWSVAEYHQMAEAGLLDETDRVELIDGELIDMAPIGSKHAFRVDCLARALQLAAGKAFLVRVQNPLCLGDHNEPQPDIAVVKDRNYAAAHPDADDVLLLVEVSDTTLAYDREVKLALYALHGIPEVWLLDVNAGELTVYCEPAEGQYRLIRKLTRAETVSPMLVPAVAIALAEVLQ